MLFREEAYSIVITFGGSGDAAAWRLKVWGRYFHPSAAIREIRDLRQEKVQTSRPLDPEIFLARRPSVARFREGEG